MALQRRAGNRALTLTLSRDSAGKAVLKEPELRPDADLSFALEYVNRYYDRARQVVDLKEKVQDQAVRNFKAFSKLTDPPSILDAVLSQIWTEALGLVPGSKLVQAAVTAGVFAVQLADFEHELGAYRGYPGATAEDMEASGPSEHTKKKVEKVVAHGKTAYEKGTAIVKAGVAAAEKRAAAKAAEAEAVETATMQNGRISDWRRATEVLNKQQDALIAELEKMVRRGVNTGDLKEYVEKKLGSFQGVTASLQDRLVRSYELELYRQSLRWVTITTRWLQTNSASTRRTALELAIGGNPSQATLRRIAELLRQPLLADPRLADVLAKELKVPGASRTEVKKVSPLEPSRPGAGG